MNQAAHLFLIFVDMFNLQQHATMKKNFIPTIAVITTIIFTSCSSYFSVEKMKSNYERRAHSTTIVGKMLSTDKHEADVYNSVRVYMNEKEVERPFQVIALGAYRPLILPLIRRERPRIEKYYFLRAAKQAYKLKADGVIIDDKNNYRIIKYLD